MQVVAIVNFATVPLLQKNFLHAGQERVVCLGVNVYSGTTTDVLMVYEWAYFFWDKMVAEMYSNLYSKMCRLRTFEF